MKKAIPFICVILLVIALAGCGTEGNSIDPGKDYSNSTLTCRVISIENTTVTSQLGELTERELGAPAGNSEGASDDGSGGTPGGEPPSGDAPGGTPDGEVPSGSGEPPSGRGGSTIEFSAGEDTITLDLVDASVFVESGSESAKGALYDISVGDVLVIEMGSNNTVASVTVKNLAGGGRNRPDGMGEQPGGGFGGSGEINQGTAANTIEEDGTYTGISYTSSGDDENALRVAGAMVALDGITVDKSGGATSNTEDGDFYGMNAGLLATDGANVTITNATVTTSAQNGNGVFSYGDGTVVTISDSNITTTADNSGGIHTTGGGAMYASNLTISTEGSSAAAIRSDRGGGTVVVDGGSYTSGGYNSPAVYSTADITVTNATLTANNSEALVIEGKNSIALIDCDVSGNMSDTEGTSSDENVHNVMIYQSMSGDADVGTSAFSMSGGNLTNNNGDLIYITNTHCVLSLSGVSIVNKETDGYLLLVSGNSGSRGWGTAGANGAQVESTADRQILEENIAVDTVSTLDLALTNGSVLTGTVNIIENAEKGTAVDNNAVVTIDEGCTWTLTGNCTLTNLNNNGTINYNDYTITLADGTVLEG